MKKPTDRKIIIELYKKMKNGLTWYISSTNKYRDIWRASEKITETKALSYNIYHKKIDPINSKIVISLEERKYEFGRVKSSISKTAREITEPKFVRILLEKVIESNNFLIKKSIYLIFRNKNDEDVIYLRKNKKGELELPKKEGFNSYSEIQKKLDFKKDGLIINNLEPFGYKTILELNNEYISIYTNIVDDFIKDKKENGNWIHIFNLIGNSGYTIEKNSFDIIKYYFEKSIEYTKN